MFAVVLLAFSHGAFGQIGISVGFGPPLLPIYEQPLLPGDETLSRGLSGSLEFVELSGRVDCGERQRTAKIKVPR